MDLVDLIATCQRHTRCSAAYCLSTTSITTNDGELKVLTQRNDSLLNSYNPVQLSAWRANVDMQYVVSRKRVIQYLAKYATKSETRSNGLRAVYGNIMKGLDDDGTSLQVARKLLINSVVDETCNGNLGMPPKYFPGEEIFLATSHSNLYYHKMH